MKKIMWILAAIHLIVTSIVLQFMPDSIPMHFDLLGNADRWGNKYESFILPVFILLITFFWHMLINYYERKAIKADVEKEKIGSLSTAKILKIAGIGMTVMFGIMQYVILYSTYKQTAKGDSGMQVDIARVSCALLGVLIVVLGNFMTKVRMNSSAGVRTVWSMYNDNTWRESNRVGAICMVVSGLLTIVSTSIFNGIISTILMLVFVLAAAIVSVVYSKKVYDKEKLKEKNK